LIGQPSQFIPQHLRLCACIPLTESHSLYSLPIIQRQLIINGTQAVKGRYPYFVSLNHLCGGALIAPDIVLAAGHCKGRNHVYARVGTYSFRHDVRGYDYEEIRIVKQVRHPSFQWLGDDEFVHDFLLLKLKHPSAQPTIRLNSHVHVPAMNAPVIAMGVGNTDPDDSESRSTVLMEVTLNAIPNEICEESSDVERNISYAHRIHPSMMCTTGGEHNSRDACAYDSGSPIIIPGESGRIEDDILVGLVSWGEECADPSFPGVNARISEAYDWIRATVCAMSAYPPDDMCHFLNDDDAVEPVREFSWDAVPAWAIAVGLLLLLGCTLQGRRRLRGRTASEEEEERWLRPTPVPLKKEEQKGLARPHRSWTKLRSYDAMAELEPLHHPKVVKEAPPLNDA
jgi:Trypsin